MTKEEKKQIIQVLSDEINRQETMFSVTNDHFNTVNTELTNIAGRKYVEGQRILNLRRMLDAFKKDFDIKI
jgi:hypothetical protein